MKNLFSVGGLSGFLVGSVAALLLVFIFIFLGPYLLYVMRSPTLQAECSKIRPGMNAREVLAFLDKNTPPYDEGNSANMIFFSRNGIACEVQIDGQGVVVNTSTVKRPAVVP